MNIFLREIKANKRSLILWSIGIVLLIAMSMAKYASISTTGQSMNEIMSQLPRSIQVVIGLDQFDIMSAVGYFGMVFLYLVLMTTIHAAMIGAGIIAKEERDRTSEFLYAKPVSRNTVITAKLCAAFVNVVVVNIASALSSLALVSYYGSGGPDSGSGSVIKLMFGMFLLQLIFMSIGAGMAAASKRPKAAVSAATGILLGTFMLSKAIDLSSSLDFLKYITPFKYFEAASILIGTGYEPIYYVLTLLILLTLLTGTYVLFRKRDIRV